MNRNAALLASLGTTFVLWLFDLLTPYHAAVSALYSVPLLLSGWTQSRRWLLFMLGIVVLGELVMPALGARPLVSPEGERVATILVSVLRLVIVGAIVYFWIGTLSSLRRERISLERQNDELEAVNDELRQREEETVRQSEELQSQTEELERQSEELRFTNEEIASREHTLEQLLELSRGLTSELEPSRVHRKICEALGLIIENSASAVLEREREELVVVCHHQFGPDGPDRERLAFDKSFASLVLAAGQTAYVEDISLRPDLAIPQPKDGAKFRSVLSTPLRVNGKTIGTLETYMTKVGRWSDLQVALLESLAAQAAISLQNAELFEAIRHERQRFESAIRTAPFGLWVADEASGDELRFNPAAALVFGVPAGESVSTSSPSGMRVMRSLCRGGRQLSSEELPHARALRGEEVRGDELEARVPDGRVVTLLVSASPLYDSRGRTSGAVCAFADITRQKALQRELEHRRREAEEGALRKTRFLAAVSHDIRTPANAINLMAELIRRSAQAPGFAEQIPSLAQRLQANALSLVEFVSDVLDLARYDSGRVDVQESEFSLGELIAAEARQLLPLAEEKGVALICDALEATIWLRTDAVKLARVLGNLIGNAIKFTDQGEIRVSAAVSTNREVLIRVRDTGSGIPERDLARIFDEFHQLRNPERNSRKGTGLGLAICQRLADVLGARIAVESELGKGSTFTLVLPGSTIVPRLDAAVRAYTGRENEPTARSLIDLRVLLIEDHETTREGTTQVLESEGARVTAAADGRSGLNALNSDEFDVLLLDMMLPDMDGRDILKLLAEKRPSQLGAVLVLTGDSTLERRQEVQRLGADGLLNKPIAVNQLLEALAASRRT